MERAATVTIPVAGPLDLVATMGSLGIGPRDPTCRRGVREFALSTRTPLGAATGRFVHEGATVQVSAWGEGADWLIGRAPGLTGSCDDPLSFQPESGRLAELARRYAGRRFTAGASPVEVAVRAVFGQRVTVEEAKAGYYAFVRGYGEPAPGPLGLALAPAPERVRSMTSVDFRRIGLDGHRAHTVRAIAVEAERILRDRDDRDAVLARLARLPGVGPWTLAHVRMYSYADASAALVGDWHVARDVVFALSGEERGDDRRMLELLEPFRGHEARVVALVMAAGIKHPRRAPGRGLNPLVRPRV